MSYDTSAFRRLPSRNAKRIAATVIKRLSMLIPVLCVSLSHVALGQTQEQLSMVSVYGAYMPMELGMDMVAARFPSLAERANRAKTDVQAAFAKTLAYIDQAISTGLPDGARKWPELKNAKRRQMLQLLTTPSDVESAVRVIETVEQACAGTFPPTLRAALSTLPSSAHPTHCRCDKCSVQPASVLEKIR